MAGLRGEMAGLRGEVTGLRGEMTELRGEMLGHFDEVYRRLDRLEQEYFAIMQALRRIEAGLAGEGGGREILERDLAEKPAARSFRIEAARPLPPAPGRRPRTSPED